MYVILLLQFPALFLGIGSLGWAWMKLSKAREDNRVYVLPAATFVFGVIVLGIGLAGWQSGLAAMEVAIEAAMAAELEPKAIRAMKREGEEIASYPLLYGTLIGVPTMIAGVMSGFMAFRRPTP